MEPKNRTELTIAVCSFLAAVGLAFTSMFIREEHDIDSSVLMMAAQFLLLTATIFGLDYHIIKRIREIK